LLLSGAIFSPAAFPEPPAEFRGVESIQRARLMETVEYLASPGLRGRLAGSPGYLEAAGEMADRFRRLGLKPGGDDGFFQKLDVEYNEIVEARLGLMEADGSTSWFQLGPDFVCRGLTGSGDLTAPVVFAGYGLSQPDKGYDDYAGIDVRGKIVLAFKEPPPFQVDSTGWGDATLPRPKGLTAAKHGAVALLIVPLPNRPRPQKPIASMLEGEGRQDERFPRMQVSVEVAEALARSAGVDLRETEARIDSTKAPGSVGLEVVVRLIVKANYHAKQPSVNVVGILPGSGPERAGESVVIGAHLDHVGSQGGELYFPGANDNASGSAAVMAIAEAFAESGERPERSVIFALFSSEEAGLFGSKRFVAAPPLPRDSILAYLNLDCVGYGDSIEVGGGKTNPRLWEMARAIDRGEAKLTIDETSEGGGADAEPFAEIKIPTLYFASKFSYTHIHLPSDTPATLNPPLLEAVARLAGRTAWEVVRGGYSRE
jgi:hypothetical protein